MATPKLSTKYCAGSMRNTHPPTSRVEADRRWRGKHAFTREWLKKTVTYPNIYQNNGLPKRESAVPE